MYISYLNTKIPEEHENIVDDDSNTSQSSFLLYFPGGGFIKLFIHAIQSPEQQESIITEEPSACSVQRALIQAGVITAISVEAFPAKQINKVSIPATHLMKHPPPPAPDNPLPAITKEILFV